MAPIAKLVVHNNPLIAALNALKYAQKADFTLCNRYTALPDIVGKRFQIGHDQSNVRLDSIFINHDERLYARVSHHEKRGEKCLNADIHEVFHVGAHFHADKVEIEHGSLSAGHKHCVKPAAIGEENGRQSDQDGAYGDR